MAGGGRRTVAVEGACGRGKLAPFSASSPAPSVGAASQSRTHGGDHRSGDHQVERHEEVRRVAAGVQRDPERERRRRSPAAAGSASGGRRRRGRRRRPSGDQGEAGEPGGVVAQVDDLVVCHWSPRIRTGKRTSATQHRRRAGAAGGQQDRRGAGAGGDQDAGAGEEVAQGVCPAAALQALHGSRRRAVQADRARRDQGAVLAEQLDPQLVAAGRRDAAAALAAVPVVGVEAVALEEGSRARVRTTRPPGLTTCTVAVVGAGRRGSGSGCGRSGSRRSG